MKSASFFVACLFLALLAAAPFPLGYVSLRPLSPEANRYGYALTSLVLLESFLPEKADSRRLRFRRWFLHRTGLRLAAFSEDQLGLVALTLAAVSLPLRSGATHPSGGNGGRFRRLQHPYHGLSALDLPALVSEYRLLVP